MTSRFLTELLHLAFGVNNDIDLTQELRIRTHNRDAEDMTEVSYEQIWQDYQDAGSSEKPLIRIEEADGSKKAVIDETVPGSKILEYALDSLADEWVIPDMKICIPLMGLILNRTPSTVEGAMLESALVISEGIPHLEEGLYQSGMEMYKLLGIDSFDTSEYLVPCCLALALTDKGSNPEVLQAIEELEAAIQQYASERERMYESDANRLKDLLRALRTSVA